jgi:hypothetical protein
MEKNTFALLTELIEIIETQALEKGYKINNVKACYFESLLKNITQSNRTTSEVLEAWIKNLSRDSI